jgi:DNA-binding response OmpR family regulator
MLPLADAARTPTVLLVEDDPEVAELLHKFFLREHLVLRHAASIAEGRASHAREAADVVILDLMLPDGNGLDLCRQLRAADALVPILILTARGDPIDRVLGLEIGADDYLPKPFEARELLARVRALLRRRQAAAQSSLSAPRRIELGALTLDLLRSTASVQDREIDLSGTEFRLLAALAQQPGQPVDRDALAAAVQPGNYRPLDRAVDVQVARLRRKLRDAAGVDCIRTIRGAGYALVPLPPLHDEA